MTKLTVTDMYIGGEPLRKILMFDPRGHYDMYGAPLVEPDLADADLAVLFLHNEGNSTFAAMPSSRSAVMRLIRAWLRCPNRRLCASRRPAAW